MFIREKLTIVVAYRDRLARFETELISLLIEQNGGELVFSTRFHTARKRNLQRIFTPSSTSSLHDSRECVVTVTKSKRIRIYPNADQRKTEKWKAAQTGEPFNMKFKSRKNPKQSCFIPKTAVKQQGVYVRILQGTLAVS